MFARERNQAHMPTEHDLDASCPFGHASTKHLLNSGASFSLEAAEASNQARALILAKFTAFLAADDTPFSETITDFNDLAAKASMINDRAPADLSAILPIPESRSFEQVWARFSQAGSPMSAFLSFAHSEAYGEHGHHAKAASSVVRDLFGPLWADFKYNAELSNWALKCGDPQDTEGAEFGVSLPLSEQDVITVKSYQLLQERWMHRKDIRDLNDRLTSDGDFLECILSVQAYLCDAIGRFTTAHPEYSNSKVVFGEIALWDPSKARFVPSSRLLKAIIHNTGPWIPINTQGTPMERLVGAIDGARKFGAFEQQICAFSQEGGVWTIDGVTQKVCPAKTSLLRLVNIAAKKRRN